MTQPITSLLANEASKQRRPNEYYKILAALDRLPNHEGISDHIAAYASMDKTAVSRRMKELLIDGKVIDTGRKALTLKGHPAIIWRKLKEPVPNIQQTLFGN